jgi:hypothetical protein
VTLLFDADKASELLRRTVTDIFADMAFFDVQALPAQAAGTAEAEASRNASMAECVAIDVMRPLSCTMEFHFAPRMKDALAESLYGVESVNDSQGRDSMLEMLNVASGSFFTAYFGPGADLKFEVPRCLFGDPEESGEVVCFADFDAQGFPLRVILRSVRYRY